MKECEIETVTNILKSIVYEFEPNDYQTFSEIFYKKIDYLKRYFINLLVIHSISFLLVRVDYIKNLKIIFFF